MSKTDEKSLARRAMETIRDAVSDGSIADYDVNDVAELSNVASDAPEWFGTDVTAALAYRDSVLANYFDADLSRHLNQMARDEQDELDRQENEYLTALAAASDQTQDSMTEVLANADAGLTSRLRKAEEEFFYG